MNSSKPVVKIVKSGVRFNAWDANGNKFTSQITTGARKKAYANGNVSLEQRVNKAGKTYWWQVPMSVYDDRELIYGYTTTHNGEVEVPTGHEKWWTSSNNHMG